MAAAKTPASAAHPVALDLQRRYADIQAFWAPHCLQHLETFNRKQTDPAGRLTVTARSFDDATALRIKAFLLLRFDRYLASQKSLGRVTETGFQERVEDAVLGRSVSAGEEALAELRRLLAEDGENQVRRQLAEHLATAFLGASPPAAGLQLFASLVTELEGITILESARALGDQRSASKWANQLTARHSKWMTRKPA